MKLPVNSFKRGLREGRTQFGLWVSLGNSYCAEVAAGAGFDWLLIDGEHAPNDLPTILSQLQAVAPYASHPVTRVVEGTPSLIKQVLDIGAQTLLVPMVETAEQAAALVADIRYPPRGIRGVGGPLVRASRWGRVDRYVHTAEEELCLLVQVETKKGLDNLDEITRVEGVDGVFIGPADLSTSLGYTDDLGHPEMQRTIETALQRIRKLGKAAGILCPEEAQARRYIECGATFVAVAVDIVILRMGIESAIRPFTAKLTKESGSCQTSS